MRVLLTIHHHLDRDAGAPGITWQLAEALRRGGHEAAVFSWDDLPPQLGPRAREALFPEFAARRMARAARDGVDVIDAATCDAWLWTLIRGRSGPGVVSRSHGLEHTYWGARRAQAREDGEDIPWLERLYHGGVRLRESARSLRGSDACIFGNRADCDRAVRELGVRRERAHVLDNGVPERFLGLPAPPRAQGGALRLAQVGSWAARKGARVITQALGPLLSAELTLTLLGAGVEANVVRAAFPTEAREHVRVVRRFDHDELPALLRDHHALVLASYAEGFSLALLEGMACGLAPVASLVGSAPDLLTDGEDALLVPPGDPLTLRAAVRRLAADRPLLDRLREAAHRRAQAYSWDRVAGDTIAIYDHACRQRRAPA